MKGTRPITYGHHGGIGRASLVSPAGLLLQQYPRVGELAYGDYEYAVWAYILGQESHVIAPCRLFLII
jgi:hypothetical protein